MATIRCRKRSRTRVVQALNQKLRAKIRRKFFKSTRIELENQKMLKLRLLEANSLLSHPTRDRGESAFRRNLPFAKPRRL